MIREELAEAISRAIGDSFGLKDTKVVVIDGQPGFGDYSTSAAFGLAKVLGKSPRDIAVAVVAEVKHPAIARVEAAGNGFINITLTPAYWQGRLAAIDPLFATNSSGAGQRLQVEFISANPTGPLTLANARGGFLGDVLGNVLKLSGYNITKEYYLNDAGGQVAKLVESAKAEAGLEIAGERQYRGDYMHDLVEQVPPREYSDDGALGRALVTTLTAEIKRAASRLGIEFDEWTSELALVESGASQRMLKWLDDQGLRFESEGAVWLASTKLGDERDRVLVRSSGEPSYLLNDLAYHFQIFTERQFTRAIKIWGADHAGQVSSLKLTAEKFAKHASLDFVLIQFVRLIQDGREVKMSKRAGTYVTIDELIDTLSSSVGERDAAGVARWFFLMRSTDTRLDFDLQLASDGSRENPYFYVMYSFARANSILAKAAEQGLAPSPHSTSLSTAGLNLVRMMDRLPDVISQVASDFAAHRLTFYGYELARLFSEYYESTRIIDLPEAEAAYQLYVVQQYLVVMRVFWSVMGIVPHERMERSGS